ncbi:MAG: MarR family winged helix-turn-helix transcriptional regulator [Pirellulales bacterium]|nr:MarR family winged helix-turn-helix transcriptional regulator [Pirellulales bacterium]
MIQARSGLLETGIVSHGWGGGRMESAQGLALQGFFDVLNAGLQSCGQLRELLSEAAREQQLSELESRVLWNCHRDQAHGASQAALAKELEMSPAHVSSLVEDLRRRGLVVGERRPPDRRRQYWSLSAEGQKRFLPLLQQLDAMIRESASAKPVAESFLETAGKLAQVLTERTTDADEEEGPAPGFHVPSQSASRAA